MKALTVQQPWAWAIINGGKTVENRTTFWKYRGPLAIHAGARISQRGMDTIGRIIDGHLWDVVDLYRGAIIGVVDLIDTHRAEPGCCDSPWAEYSYREIRDQHEIERRDIVHLVLKNPRPVMPLDCAGKLGLWNVPADIEALLQLSVDAAVEGLP